MTNVSCTTHSPRQVGDLYRCRWGMEVDNGVNKKGASVHKIGAGKQPSIRIELSASMIQRDATSHGCAERTFTIREGKKPG